MLVTNFLIHPIFLLIHPIFLLPTIQYKHATLWSLWISWRILSCMLYLSVNEGSRIVEQFHSVVNITSDSSKPPSTLECLSMSLKADWRLIVLVWDYEVNWKKKSITYTHFTILCKYTKPASKDSLVIFFFFWSVVLGFRNGKRHTFFTTCKLVIKCNHIHSKKLL